MRINRGFIALLRKEIVLAVKNQVFILLFGVPVVVVTFLGLAFSPDRQAAPSVVLVVPAAPERSDPLANAIRALPTVRVLGVYTEERDALDHVEDGRAVGAIDLTSAAIGPSGPEGTIRVILDETRPVLSEIVRATLQAWSSASGTRPVQLQVTLLRGVSPRDSSIPLWLLISALSVSMGSVPLLITDEKEHRTLDALLVTPLGAPAIVLAKAVLGTLTILLMSALIVVLNGTTVADPGLLVASLLAGSAGLVTLGLLIGTIAPNQASAAPVASVALLLLILPVILGQFGTGPAWSVVQVLPTYHLNALLSAGLFGGAASSDSALRLSYLVLLGTVGGALATWSMLRERAS